MSLPVRALLHAALIATLCAACKTSGVLAPAPAAAPQAFYESLGREFFVRQAVIANVGGEERRFEIALQSRCGELRVVGLSGFGVRLFSAVRNREGLEVETLPGLTLPFEPERVLRDVELTFFRSRAPVVGEQQRVAFAGLTVEEHWHAGRLVSRRVVSENRPDEPPLEIRYHGELTATDISERVELSNPTFGYALTIHNHHVEELACSPAEAPQ